MGGREGEGRGQLPPLQTHLPSLPSLLFFQKNIFHFYQFFKSGRGGRGGGGFTISQTSEALLEFLLTTLTSAFRLRL